MPKARARQARSDNESMVQAIPAQLMALIFTVNGKPTPPPNFPPPLPAIDFHVMWNNGVIIAAWWTTLGIPLLIPPIIIPPGANDIWLRLPGGGQVPPPAIPAPAWADDLHGYVLPDGSVELWWTEHGRPRERVPVSKKAKDFHFRIPRPRKRA